MLNVKKKLYSFLLLLRIKLSIWWATTISDNSWYSFFYASPIIIISELTNEVKDDKVSVSPNRTCLRQNCLPLDTRCTSSSSCSTLGCRQQGLLPTLGNSASNVIAATCQMKKLLHFKILQMLFGKNYNALNATM